MQIEYQNYNNHWMPDQLFNKNYVQMKIRSHYLTLLKIKQNEYCFTQKTIFTAK